MIQLTPEQLSLLIAEAVAKGVVVALSQNASERRNSNAERCARYRERRGQNHVKPCRDMSNHVVDTVVPSPSSLPLPPSLSLPSTPPLPLTPSIPHSSIPPPTGISPSQKRQSKREQREQSAREAAQVPIPTEIQHPLIESLWIEFCEYRREMSILKGIDWTPRAARHALVECKNHGTAKSIAALRKAMARGWRGLVWENLEQETSMVESNELSVTNLNTEPEPEIDLWERLEANRAKAAAREAAENAEPDSMGDSEWT